MNMIDRDISRRGVIAGLGGMAFCIAVGNDGVRLMSQAQANALANSPVNPWVRIATDGTITILSAGAEMGQGSMTSLRLAGAQVRKVLIANAAEKWGVDAATLKTEPGVVINPANGARLTTATSPR